MTPLEADDIDPAVPADIERAAAYLLATRAHGFEAPSREAQDAAAADRAEADVTKPCVRAVGDLHATSRDNRDVVAALQPAHRQDWLIVAGDVAERLADIADVLATLAERFDTLIWVPGNHELWGGRDGLDTLPAPARYDIMVAICRRLGIYTPEDEFPIWRGDGGPVVIVPMFLLYDYSWRPDPAQSVPEALASARARRVVATDEYLIDPYPHRSISAWCAQRLAATTARLARLDAELPTVLVNHWPLLRQPTEALHFPDFAMWCGTEHTAQWPARYRAQTCVYGHLHIPRSHAVDGVRHEEVSLGYPREWARRGRPRPLTRQIVPVPSAPPIRWLVDDQGAPFVAAPGDSGAPFAGDTSTSDWELIVR